MSSEPRARTCARMIRWALPALLLVGIGAAAAATGSSFVEFESGHVRPLALSPDGTQLFAVNTPDNRLEIFAVTDSGLTHTGSVQVGLEPVAVAALNGTEVWVVNHLSDSVSIVDLSGPVPRVTSTLLVGDEPRDIVFAGPGGSRAFITTAHRGQNSPVDPQLTTPGVGRADVWVFDTNNLGASLGGTPLTIVTLFGDTPRALAATPDGSTVYAAVFHSGNQTTTVSTGVVCTGPNGAPDSNGGPCVIDGTTYPGGVPAPDTNVDGVPHPATGLVVKFNPVTSAWEDTLGRDWSNAVKFSLPDKDVFAIDANATPPVEKGFFAHVGTVLFNMVVNPVNGNVYVTNTDAHNEVRFEGPGIFGGSTVQGHLHEADITVLSGTSVAPRHLNKHIDYSVRPAPKSVNQKSLATPVGMAVSSDGTTLYVTAFGSSKIGVFNTAEIENDTFVPATANQIAVSGGGPSGVVLDEARGRLYVTTRFDDSLSIVDTTAKKEVAHMPLYNPEPASVVNGRQFFYNASLTSSNGEAACASCHIFGDFDSLAWDLGNPDNSVTSNPNPFRIPAILPLEIHPMKGPMTTQSLRGLVNNGPMHWRGDRTGGLANPLDPSPTLNPLDSSLAFKQFIVAFQGLLGAARPISDAQMQAFTDFILQVTYPPNPIRALDNSLTPDQQAGHDFFMNSTPSDTLEPCHGCHALDPANGFFGTDGFSSFENESQDFKVPHLRNAYQKVGMFGMPSTSQFIESFDNGFQGDQVRGFGFLHDGSVDTLFRFHHATVFDQHGGPLGNPGGIPIGSAGDVLRRQLEDFVLAFDSDLAPIVGQQITLTSTNAGTVGPRINLLLARAAAGDCDVVVKSTIAGEPRGAYRTAAGTFQTDRAGDPLLSDATVRAYAATPGQELTYTAVPPGSGVRIGIDRDSDGFLDSDERDAGSDPANPLSIPPSAITCAGTVSVDKPVLKVTKNGDPAGDENLTLNGQLQLTSQTPAIDPLNNGFRFRVDDTNGNPIFWRVLPTGAPASKGAAGWAVNASGTIWTYKDTTGTVASGITKVVIKNKSAMTPGLFTFAVTGKKNDFQVTAAEIPVHMLVVLGGADQSTAGQCGTRAFNASSGSTPRCKLAANGNSLSCK